MLVEASRGVGRRVGFEAWEGSPEGDTPSTEGPRSCSDPEGSAKSRSSAMLSRGTREDEAVEPTTRAGAIGVKVPSWTSAAP